MWRGGGGVTQVHGFQISHLWLLIFFLSYKKK